MKKHKNYNIDRVVSILNRKNDCRVIGNTIYVLSNSSKNKSNDLGNSSWGKIDFLLNNGFFSSVVDEFPKKEFSSIKAKTKDYKAIA